MAKRKFKNPEQAHKNMCASQQKRWENSEHVAPYKMTDEIAQKISKTLTGRKATMEARKNISIAGKKAQTPEVKKRRAESHIGLKQSDETKNKKSVSMKKYLETHPASMTGKTQPPEAIIKMRIARELAMKENRHFKGYFREDLQQYFRSKLEANYARFMKWMDISYEYETEKCVFKLNDGRAYICDFYIPEINQYVETKGYDWKNKMKNKYETFKQEYPEVKWNILYQTSNEWKQIVTDYSKLIPNWEFQNYATRCDKNKINQQSDKRITLQSKVYRRWIYY
jgi:hypothetical protein